MLSIYNGNCAKNNDFAILGVNNFILLYFYSQVALFDFAIFF